METTPEILAKHVRPYWGRIAVLPAVANEEQRDSGLVLPVQEASDLERGIVVEVDQDWDWGTAGGTAAVERLVPGTVVWYRGGVRCRDLTLLDLHEIYAYENV